MTKTKEIVVGPSANIIDPAIIESLVLSGDMSRMNPQQRVQYFHALCTSLGLNPLTQPFQIIKFQGKEVLYATKACTEQLRKINAVSVIEMNHSIDEGILTVKVKAQDSKGRYDISTGALSIKGLGGDALSNAFMKCETKAKRRVTLSICGLGMLDESEVESIGKYETMPLPELSQQPDDLSSIDYAGELMKAKTLGELATAWNKIPKAAKNALEVMKNKRKDELRSDKAGETHALATPEQIMAIEGFYGLCDPEFISDTQAKILNNEMTYELAEATLIKLKELEK